MASMHLSLYLTVTIVLVTFCHITFIESGKVLVVPIDGSHWLSMRPLVKLLRQRGHHAVVVAPDINLHLQTSQDFQMKFYPVSFSSEQLHNHFSSMAREVFTERPFLQKFLKLQEKMREGTTFMLNTCQRLLNNNPLIQSLEEMTFDVVLTDPALPCGQILAEHLSVPSVFFLRGIPCHLDSKASKCPIPLSYVPRILTSLTDEMNFPQRLKNLMFDLSMYFLCDFVYSPYQLLASEFLQREINLQEILSHASIWLMRMDFVFDFPRPVMPNMVLIGGINCVQMKVLNQYLHIAEDLQRISVFAPLELGV
ncbi:UDP-glucuronosyltransferase 1A1-like [Mixophyes fleayi]|uniref:UDP-glucuronosyltransferase 1A1-like n=1 Tax=Mixophyes fleayi TaxID=3061075 RepID=UPI003F4DDDD9